MVGLDHSSLSAASFPTDSVPMIPTMPRFLSAGLFLLFPFCAARAEMQTRWSELPPLPDSPGLAGAFAGFSGPALIVAGGANFPDKMPWDGGTKVWHDAIWVLESPGASWRQAGTLPGPLGYGVSIELAGGVLCIGGSDATRHHTSVFLLRWTNNRLEREDWPALPEPLANMTGALAGQTIHVVGGTAAPDSTTALPSHWTLDVKNPAAGWKSAPPVPGEGRMLAVSGSRNGVYYTFSGAALAPGPDGKPARTYLNEAWSFSARDGWKRLADLPRPAVAAPSPAPSPGASHLLVIGGDDGSRVGHQPPADHPGFARDILAYDTITNTWAAQAIIPDGLPAPVTASAVIQGKAVVLASGEIRPGIRTPRFPVVEILPGKPSFGWINWAVVVVYLAAMIGVGWWFMNRESSATTDAYFRGGQRVPWWVAGLSIFATMLSSLTFMGIPARSYMTDVSWFIGQLPILLITPLVLFFYLPFFRKLDLTSAYEYLEKRFNLACRIFAALSFIFYHVGRVAVVLYLPALALAAVSDIGVITAILVIGVLCLVYTVMGGIEAVVWTDAVQAIVLMGGALLCFALAVARVDGGWSGMLDIAAADAKGFSLQWSNFDLRDGTSSVVVLFIAFFFNSFIPYTSSQDVVQRYVTTRDLPAARRSLWTNLFMSLSGAALFFALGVAIYAFFKTNPGELDPALAANDSILPWFIMKELPVGVSGLVIAAIFAASQSTISSSLNSIATSFSKDIDMRVLRPGRDDATYLSAAKWVVVLVGLLGIAVAVWISIARIQSAFNTFNMLIGLTAGALGGLFALGVFVRRANGTGAMIGAITATALVVSLHVAGAPVTGLLYGGIGCLATVLVGWIASLILPGRRGEGLSLGG